MMAGEGGTTVPRHRIAVIAGDGIGREVVPEGVRVLEKVASRFGLDLAFTDFPWSCEYYEKHGRMMPEEGSTASARSTPSSWVPSAGPACPTTSRSGAC